MSKTQYDEQGGIISLEKDLGEDKSAKNKEKTAYSFLERLMIRSSKKLNYLLDKDGKYKCRQEGLPKVIRIGPSNRCTAQCFYCPREHILQNGSGYLDFSLYEELIAWAKDHGVRDVSFALFGEPLLHPRIFEMISLAKENGIRWSISSNAIIMHKDKADRILELEPESIEMSLDGYNSLEFEKGKKVDAYTRAKENIEYLLIKAKEKKSMASFNIHFVDAGNVSVVNKRKFVNYWSKQLQDLRHETSYYYEPHNWAGTRADLQRNLNPFDRLLNKFELKKPCIYIKGINIDWNGNVIICTNDPSPKAVIGNIQKEKIQDIYNGEKRMKYLDAHEVGDFRELNCARCNVNSYWPLVYIKKRIFNFISK